ncbi:hypothetical protein MJ391_23370 [Escherichia coli]|nr:hypothetical protein MJ391_23370 [Escherichia coli]
MGALILFVVAKRGHAINTGKVLRVAPWQIVIFSLGMYLVVAWPAQCRIVGISFWRTQRAGG